MLRSHDLHLLMSFFTIEIVADLTFPLPLLYLMISFSPRFFTSSLCSFQGTLVGSSGLEPPLPAVRNWSPCFALARIAPLLTGLSPRFFRHWRRSAPAPRYQARLSLAPRRFPSPLDGGWETGGLKWTRTTDLALIRRAL